MGKVLKNALVAVAVCIASGGAAVAATVSLNGTVRDFRADGANFEGSVNGGAGMVQSTLSGSSPSLTAYGAGQVVNTGDGAFSNWYTRPTDSVSHSLTLNETAPGSGVFQYTSNSFFPIDGQLYGNQGNSHNYHFTYAIAATFGYTQGAGQTFSFTGDDDVWVYFDNLLGIDLGGVHGAQSATVNLDTLFGAAGGRASGNYSFNFFFAERHTTQSNLRISTSLDLQSNQVPEPSSLALMGLGLLAFGTIRRRKQA